MDGLDAGKGNEMAKLLHQVSFPAGRWFVPAWFGQPVPEPTQSSFLGEFELDSLFENADLAHCRSIDQLFGCSEGMVDRGKEKKG